VTPDIPIEFLVRGTAISAQGSAKSIETWKETVKAAGRAAVPDGAWALQNRVAVTIYYFPEGQMQGDVDNIVKPILDAMCRSIYVDDHQVERVVVQKFEPDNIFTFADPSPVLLDALAVDGATVYIRVTDNLYEELQ
jgi:crossover junction endodeoxyribonuclease RusA